MKRGLFKVALLLATSLSLAEAAARAQLQNLPFRNPSLSLDQRLADLVSRMSLEEKAAQLQNAAPAIPRLGIPAYEYWNEALHGVARAGEATIFPQAIGMAATWDKQLMLAEGKVVAIEGRAKYNQAQREQNYGRYFGLTFWSPNINIFRDPRWGRGQETLGEDPYLTGMLANQFIRGVQGDHPKYLSAVATSKHFAVHSGPEPLRHGFNVDPSRRDLSETYLPAFRTTIMDAQAYSLMCAYNAVDGKPACANPELLLDTLRKDWGFGDKLIVSDCGAIDDIVSGHKYVKTQVEAAAVALKSGTDLACTFRDEYLDLPKAVAQGLIGEAEIDVAVKRAFAARMRMGLFDPPEMVPFSSIPISANHSEENRAVALRAAREAIVLMKNDGVLPLDKPGTKVAVIGPNATSMIGLLGNYNGTPTKAVLPLDGISATFGVDRVSFAQGSPFVEQMAVPVPRSVFGSGLKVSFYNSLDFTGPAVAELTHREIENFWQHVDPAPGVDRKRFSARWTGTFTPPAAGNYTFRVEQPRCDERDEVDSYRVVFEGAPEYRATSACSGSDNQQRKDFTIAFADTRPRAFTLEFSHGSPRAPSGVTFSWQPPLDVLRAEAVEKARQADVVVAVLGLNAWLEGEEMPLKVPGFVGGDRTDISLPPAQSRLLEALQAIGKPVVVVLQTGSAIALGKLGEKANAVLTAWYGGELGGQAIGEVLRGTVNPAGRLPVTFYASADQLPPFEDYAMAGRTYRYFAGKPEYPFGHGLSYTNFRYSDLRVEKRQVKAGENQTVSVTVRNTGDRPGEEVAQLYLSVPGREGAPLRSLKGFDRVHLAPGESRRLTFTLVPRDLALADADGVMRIKAAGYRLWVGGGQPDTGAPGEAASFTVTGNQALPR